MSQETDDVARRMGMVTAETHRLREYGRGGIAMPPRLFAFRKEGAMPHYKTREDYWRAHGWGQLASEVGRRTAEDLRRRGLKANPESAVYQNTFNRLAEIYKKEVKAEKRAKEQREAEWLAQHKPDTDEQLLAYLRAAVTEPQQKPGRITGGKYIAARFGGWRKALVKAGLIEPEEQAQSPPEQ